MFLEAGCPHLKNNPDGERAQGRRHEFLNTCFLACPRVCSVFIDFDESPQAPVIGPFHIIREKAGWKLFHAPVVLKTLAADSLAAAGFITAVAVGHVLVCLTFFHLFLHPWFMSFLV
jgi:hypothetical protein